MPGWSTPATLTIPSQVNPGADCIRGEALPDYALTDPAESHELKRARQAHVHHRLRQRVHRPTDIKTRVPAPHGPRRHRIFVFGLAMLGGHRRGRRGFEIAAPADAEGLPDNQAKWLQEVGSRYRGTKIRFTS